MEFFTVVIILWAIFQAIVAAIKKKDIPQTPGKLSLSGSSKLPNGGLVRDVIEGISRGTWKEQLKQALENGPYQAEPLESTQPKVFEDARDYYVETEGTQGLEGTQGTEGTSEYIGILGLEAYKPTEETPREERNPSGLSGVSLSLTEGQLVQGVMWAEILGKPRARHPFKGPRG